MPKGYKFEKLQETIADSLATNPWHVGDRFHSETQLCNKYKVSRQTIRKAMQGLVDDGLLVRRQGSGTYVTEKAVARRNTRTHIVGILVTYLSDYIFPIIIKELEEVFSGAGYTVQLASTGNSSKRERELLLKMLKSNVDGIILEPTKSALPSPNTLLYRELLDKNFPMVTIHASYNDVALPLVALDDNEAGYLAANHLLSLSHDRIGAILKSDDLQGHRRYQGILRAHAAHQTSFDDQKVYWFTTEDSRNFRSLEQPILERLRNCSAVVCYNDLVALEYENMLLRAGLRIPQDQAIVSIDDSRYAAIAPVPLTSVHSPIAEIGQTAAKQLLRLISGEQFDASQLFTPTLVKRASSGGAYRPEEEE